MPTTNRVPHQVRQITQAGEILGADGRTGFYLDADDPPVRRLDDRVDLELVLGAVVKEPTSLL